MPTYLNIFSSETTGPIEAKFHMEPPWVGETHVCSNGPGHTSRMAAMPIYGKKLKNLVLRNLKADDLETWYAVLGAQVLPTLFNWWSWVDPDLFYGKVKFSPLRFCIGKR